MLWHNLCIKIEIDYGKVCKLQCKLHIICNGSETHYLEIFFATYNDEHVLMTNAFSLLPSSSSLYSDSLCRNPIFSALPDYKIK